MSLAIRAISALGLFALTAGWMSAQSTAGSIGGVVQDASGGLMPGVKVTVTDESTNVSTVVQTNHAGGVTDGVTA